MKYFPQIALADDVTADDEIDDLFSQLEQIEPPPSLVECIMQSVGQMPPLREQAKPLLFCDDADGLIVRSDHLSPS